MKPVGDHQITGDRMASSRSAPEKRINPCCSSNRRKIEPEIPDVPETPAKVVRCSSNSDRSSQEKGKRPFGSTKSFGKSMMRKWSLAGFFKNYQSSEKILRREKHHQDLELNRMVISFGL
ncbi:hypothetical protein R1sor_000243 [Riccia sorocarpa]|uniref:Uncharacterized protein n=1 Tax=Riccia sorocarpa TaxID=122646 RepID=A0ABD3GU89_9MARC